MRLGCSEKGPRVKLVPAHLTRSLSACACHRAWRRREEEVKERRQQRIPPPFLARGVLLLLSIHDDPHVNSHLQAFPRAFPPSAREPSDVSDEQPTVGFLLQPLNYSGASAESIRAAAFAMPYVQCPMSLACACAWEKVGNWKVAAHWGHVSTPGLAFAVKIGFSQLSLPETSPHFSTPLPSTLHPPPATHAWEIDRQTRRSYCSALLFTVHARPPPSSNHPTERWEHKREQRWAAPRSEDPTRRFLDRLRVWEGNVKEERFFHPSSHVPLRKK